MAKLTRADLKFDYEWSADRGDNATLTHREAGHLSLSEGCAMLHFLNKLGVAEGRVVYGYGNEFTKGALQRIEWMLRERLKLTAPDREAVIQWINDHWEKHRGTFSSLHSPE